MKSYLLVSIVGVLLIMGRVVVKKRRQSHIECVICAFWGEYHEYELEHTNQEMFRALNVFDLRRKYHRVVPIGENLYRLGWGKLLNNAKLKLTGEVDINELCRLEERRRLRLGRKGE